MNFNYLQHVKITSILDIGANQGQFAELARKLWPKTIIHSFEPLPQDFAILEKRFEGDSAWYGHNVALSDVEGEVEFNVSSFTQSSSILEMGDLHKTTWPFSADNSKIKVKAITLDSIAPNICTSNYLVKIDVQGAELKVISGGINTIKNAAVCYIEASFFELYIGQPLFFDIMKRMDELGFRYMGNAFGVLYSEINGLPLEEDSIYCRKGMFI